MEHATNIAYMQALVNGYTQYESTMAHELSHHWFGDLATCETAGDMWLNEGWARYCESIFS
jgi:aminopeptidase N